jgi:hypothetical protein
MKSDLNLLQIDDAVDVTSRHNLVDDHDIEPVLGHRVVRRVDLVNVVDTSSRHCVNIFLRLID